MPSARTFLARWLEELGERAGRGGDVVSIVGAVAGAVFVALTASLIYRAFRPQPGSGTPEATR